MKPGKNSVSFLIRVSLDTRDLESRIKQVYPGALVHVRQVGSQVILKVRSLTTSPRATFFAVGADGATLQWRPENGGWRASMGGAVPHLVEWEGPLAERWWRWRCRAGGGGGSMSGGGAGGGGMSGGGGVMMGGMVIINRMHVPGPAPDPAPCEDRRAQSQCDSRVGSKLVEK